jgi:hypothetical protein
MSSLDSPELKPRSSSEKALEKSGDALPTETTHHTTHHDEEASPVEKLPQAGPPPGGDFPDGGKAAWLTVAGAAACLFCSFGWVNCVGIFQEYYSTHSLSSYSQSQISWIPTLQGEWQQDPPFIERPLVFLRLFVG